MHNPQSCPSYSRGSFGSSASFPVGFWRLLPTISQSRVLLFPAWLHLPLLPRDCTAPSLCLIRSLSLPRARRALAWRGTRTLNVQFCSLPQQQAGVIRVSWQEFNCSDRKRGVRDWEWAAQGGGGVPTPGGTGSQVGLDDLGGLFQPLQSQDCVKSTLRGVNCSLINRTLFNSC